MAGSSVRIATLQTATVQGVTGMGPVGLAGGTATLPAMGAAVTAGGTLMVTATEAGRQAARLRTAAPPSPSR